ncbi:3646_t:CDS:2 [Ambispora gerdemannii]|uniref:3646_t:CDS:1 n=1 Tax=Ambispora gerdemannii TaxID=144530 RepID=A0A9N9CFD5_9GLOM|nr:3646_t:CDS:2 [Ambispora gerdemannii]
MSKDVFTPVKEDHSIIKQLCEPFKNEKDEHGRQKIANTIIREVLGNGKDFIDHTRKEHLDIKNIMYELDGMKVSDAGYVPLWRDSSNTLKKKKKTISLSYKNASLKNKCKNLVKADIILDLWPQLIFIPAEIIVGAAITPADKLRDITREFVEVHRT